MHAYKESEGDILEHCVSKLEGTLKGLVEAGYMMDIDTQAEYVQRLTSALAELFNVENHDIPSIEYLSDRDKKLFELIYLSK